MRLDKLLAHSGLGTRREVQSLLRAGRVTVNRQLVRDGAFHVSEADAVFFDGNAVTLPGSVTVIFNKPAGLITSTSDSQDTIYTVLPFDPKKVKPAGRLDKDTEGLLLLTDDGLLNFRITSPRWHLEKEYWVDLDRPVEGRALSKLLEPMTLENGTQVRGALLAEPIGDRRIRLVIDQGKYHQVKRMIAAMGYRVERLLRVRIGPIPLGDLPQGKWRRLETEEMEEMRAALGLSEKKVPEARRKHPPHI